MAVLAACSTSALAWEYESDGGWKLNLTNTVTAASSWRVEGRDKLLVSPNDALAAGLAPPVAGSYNSPTAVANAKAMGYLAGNQTDTSNLNYDKGDRYSTILKFVSDLEFKKGDTGGLIRVKGWYDQALNKEVVPYGHQNTGFAGAIGSASPTTAKPAQTLSDEGFDPLNRFDGLYLLDAYVYTGFDVGAMPAQVRVGRQAVNWGESVFIQGINQMSPLDVPSLRRAGTEIKEALLPVWSVTGNIGLSGGMSLDAFYQLKWEPTAIDSCGTFWSPVELKIGNGAACNMVVAINSSNPAYYNGTGVLSGLPGALAVKDYPHTGVPAGYADKPSNGGQWGLSFRFPVEAIDTEFGVYAMNLHARTPQLMLVNASAATIASATAAANQIGTLGQTAAVGLAQARVGNGLGVFWDYPEDIKIFGLSAATNFFGYSFGAELSHQKDVPVGISGGDLLFGGVGYNLGTALKASAVPALVAAGTATAAGSGPMGARIAAVAPGGVLPGYDRFNKTQFQINALGALPAILGATNGLLVSEVGFQWNNVPESNGSNVRYGRNFVYQAASSPLWGGLLAGLATCAGGLNVSPEGCVNDGFVTKYSWGYRLRASLDYPGFLGSGWTATPSVFWAHDVKGQAMDGQFNEGKQVLALGLKFDLQKTHKIDLTYTTYANSATYDNFRDRDNVSISYSYAF